MNMSYNSNPNIPKVRAQAVKMVRAGYSTREVARHFGYSQSAVVKWCQKIHPEERQFMIILTESSQPHSYLSRLDSDNLFDYLKIYPNILSILANYVRGKNSLKSQSLADRESPPLFCLAWSSLCL